MVSSGYQLIPIFLKLFNDGYVDIDRFLLGSAERKRTFVQANSPGSLVTIIDCITATGHYLDPGVIFKGQKLQKQYFSRIQESVPKLALYSQR